MTRLTLPQYRLLRRVHGWTAVAPVGAYVVFHILVNATVIAGPEVYGRAGRALEALPGRVWLEWFGIALPICLHVALGIVLGNTGWALGEPRPYRRAWMQNVQRGAGAYLVFFAIFHVWSVRFSPDAARAEADFHRLMVDQLRHPGVLALYALGVVTACAHLGLGLLRILGAAPGAPPSRRVEAVVLASAAVLALIGVNALLGFVHDGARWLESHGSIPMGVS